MNLRILLLTFLISSILIVDALAQTMPLVYSVENTGANCPIPYLPSLSELPYVHSLPDPFEWADGRGRISNYSDWEYRRAEIGAQIQDYEIGQRPVRPDTITASYSGGVLTVIVTVNGRTLTLTSQVILPAGAGPFPAVIGMNSPSGSIPSSIFSSRNIAQITFNHDQVTSYGSPSNTDPFFQLYPNLNLNNTGQYDAWSWGVSRIIDGLELVQNVLPIDLKHIAVTGCSYAGKMALYAGAFDERIALTIAQESGGGGATSWRYSHSEVAGSVEDIDNTNYDWFANQMNQFSGANVSLLPEDHHELMAMCAPRALYVTANPDYTWLSNPSCFVASKACQTVYNALGIADRFGFSIVGGHMHCAVPDTQLPEIGAFVDKFLLGKDSVNTNISDSPFNIDLSPWITWTNPVLSNGTSYFGKTSLTDPSDFQSGMDTIITFKWNKANDAEKYYIELSTDPTFGNIDRFDSTTTDTSKTFTGLLQGKEYYWRVQIKSAAGAGPWSNIWHLTTTIALPDMPQLVGATPYSGRDGWYTLTWNRTNKANQYNLQLSNNLTFTSVFISVTTADTSDLVSGLVDGNIYYWRVQATNVSGPGPWSNALHLSTLPAPTNLVLQRNAPNEITLTWINNATSEDGSVIERKLSTQTSFSVLDTLKGSGNQYVDTTVESGYTYVYRVSAYIDSVESDYSNEDSLVLTGIVNKEEEIPTEYSISQNYPNPFNPTTTIKFGLPQRALTKITIYDILGREIQTIINKELEAGYHEINVNADNFPSGVYFYRIQSESFINTKKMILMK